ncbi:MAG: hypothetical protein ACJZ4J_01370 [Candidatus Poseidoniales archaeon]
MTEAELMISESIEEYGKSIEVSELLLDTDNPRLYASRRGGKLPEIQGEIKDELLSKSHIPQLKRSIFRDGLHEPIYVQYRPAYEKYVVIEGNTRAAIHISFIESGTVSESGVPFDVITGHVIKPNLGASDLSIMKVIWQTGKEDWGKCERAMVMYEMKLEHGLTVPDIATHFQCSKGDVEKDLAALALLQEYQIHTGEDDPSKFSYFSKECPAKVRNWFGDSASNKQDYFDYISEGRIPSVAMRGGLRDFQKFVENPTIMAEFKDNPNMTIESGVSRIYEEDLLASFKWMKNIDRYVQDLYTLLAPKYQVMLMDDVDTQNKLKRLNRATAGLLGRIDDDS